MRWFILFLLGIAIACLGYVCNQQGRAISAAHTTIKAMQAVDIEIVNTIKNVNDARITEAATMRGVLMQILELKKAVGNKQQGQNYTLREVVVTAYCPCSECCNTYADGVTACGHKIQAGDCFVAAPTNIPYHTKIAVPGYNNGMPVEVLDRGGDITDGRLDVFYPTHQEALSFGKQTLLVKYYD